MKYLILISSLLLSTQQIYANQTFSHEGPPPQLVELYTSEGCSSCPPADRYMSSLINEPGLWSKIIPLAFHVDYWDYIGWEDRFAQPTFKQRQYDYRRNGLLRSVYTPGWIVDGKEWRGFFQGRSLPALPDRSGQKLSAELENQDLSISFEAQEPTTTLTAHVALIGFDQQSNVTAGENRGRTLSHQFIVLDKQQQTKSGSQWQFKIPKSDISSRTAIAIWITQPDMTILQATGGWIQAK
jgi:hypothetical protein